MIRSLTPGETALAREAFGEHLRPSTVRFLASPWPFDRAFVPGRWFGREWIVWPARTASYESPVGKDLDWCGLNLEQQAMVVEHRFRLVRGGAVPAPADFYDRVCPLGPRIKS